MSKVEPIPLNTALARLVELAEFELLSPACPDPPEGWQQGLKEATVTTRKFLAEIREPAGRFFTSADEKRHKLVAKENQKMSSKTQMNSFQLEVEAIIEKALRGNARPDETNMIVKEVRRLWAKTFDDPAKTKDTKPARPGPLFQTAYLGGTPPIAGGVSGDKSKEQRKGIGLIDQLYAANQRQNQNGGNKR